MAFAVVIGFGGLGSGGETELPALAGGVADEAVAVTAPARVDLSRVDAGRLGGGDDPVSAVAEVSDSDVQRAHAYMLHHTQQQAMNQAGVMSFVKMATYEAP